MDVAVCDVRRGWVINPLDVTYYWLIPFAIIPALLGTILIFLDQQITSVIVNRKEHKLKVIRNKYKHSLTFRVTHCSVYEHSYIRICCYSNKSDVQIGKLFQGAYNYGRGYLRTFLKVA